MSYAKKLENIDESVCSIREIMAFAKMPSPWIYHGYYVSLDGKRVYSNKNGRSAVLTLYGSSLNSGWYWRLSHAGERFELFERSLKEKLKIFKESFENPSIKEVCGSQPGKFRVVRDDSNVLFSVSFGTIEKAKTYTEEVARKNPGVSYSIVQVIGTAVFGGLHWK